MGVYIPKMTMPRNCSLCPCARPNISRNGIECSAVNFYAENLMPQKGIMECCPLVPIPPHGDLIDKKTASENLAKVLIEKKPPFSYPDWNDAVVAMLTAPTIIESEGEDG